MRAKPERGLPGRTTDRLGMWALSVILVILCPLLPLLIELMTTHAVRSDSYLITTAVLCTAFCVSAGHSLLLAFYLMTFLLTFAWDIVEVASHTEIGIGGSASAVLLVICLTHAAERFWWHVLEDRPIIEILRQRKRDLT